MCLSLTARPYFWHSLISMAFESSSHASIYSCLDRPNFAKTPSKTSVSLHSTFVETSASNALRYSNKA